MVRKGEQRSPESIQRQRKALRKTLKQKHLVRLERLKDKLKSLLKKEGPMNRHSVEEKLGFSSFQRKYWLRELLLMYPDIFCCTRIAVGPVGANRKNFSSYELFNGLSVIHMGSIIYLRDDERIVSFVGSRIMVPKTRGQVCALSSRLNRIFGKELTHKIIEHTGYQYSK